MKIIIVAVLLVIVLLILFFKNTKEGYSPAALTQLVAKDPQDTYLTGDAWQHMYYPYSPYDAYVWGYPYYTWPTYGAMRMKKSQRPPYVYGPYIA